MKIKKSPIIEYPTREVDAQEQARMAKFLALQTRGGPIAKSTVVGRFVKKTSESVTVLRNSKKRPQNSR